MVALDQPAYMPSQEISTPKLGLNWPTLIIEFGAAEEAEERGVAQNCLRNRLTGMAEAARTHTFPLLIRRIQISLEHHQCAPIQYEDASQ
jgi:hypothetical protein